MPRRRKWRAALLALLLVLTLPLTLIQPIATVKGVVVNTRLVVGFNAMSIDAGRIAFINSATNRVCVYNIETRVNRCFATPITGGLSFPGLPRIYGDKLVITSSVDIASTTTTNYCVLPRPIPLGFSCTWLQIRTELPGWSFAVNNPPTLGPDLVVWATSTGFAFYRFSSSVITDVTTPTPPGSPLSLSTNGAIISFAARLTPAAPSMTIMYYDITSPSPVIVDTGLPGFGNSLSQYTIAFNDGSVASTCPPANITICDSRIRYYDILQSQASPAGAGPLGTLGLSAPSIWGDRIVFTVTESSLNSDCNGNGSFFSGNATEGSLTPDTCIGYWNIRPGTRLVSILAAQAAPSGLENSAMIYDNTIMFITNLVAGSTIQYMTVPMFGDVNQDGLVDVVDLSAVGGCFGQFIKGTTC